MTAIINTRREQRSPFALPGLVIPGLGHMLCWLVTTLPTMFAPSLKRSKGSHRTLSAEQRAYYVHVKQAAIEKSREATRKISAMCRANKPMFAAASRCGKSPPSWMT